MGLDDVLAAMPKIEKQDDVLTKEFLHATISGKGTVEMTIEEVSPPPGYEFYKQRLVPKIYVLLEQVGRGVEIDLLQKAIEVYCGVNSSPHYHVTPPMITRADEIRKLPDRKHVKNIPTQINNYGEALVVLIAYGFDLKHE